MIRRHRLTEDGLILHESETRVELHDRDGNVLESRPPTPAELAVLRASTPEVDESHRPARLVDEARANARVELIEALEAHTATSPTLIGDIMSVRRQSRRVL